MWGTCAETRLSFCTGSCICLCVPLLSMGGGWPPRVGACVQALERPVEMGTRGGAEYQRGALCTAAGSGLWDAGCVRGTFGVGVEGVDAAAVSVCGIW